jgi:hypothetical protein
MVEESLNASKQLELLSNSQLDLSEKSDSSSSSDDEVDKKSKKKKAQKHALEQAGIEKKPTKEKKQIKRKVQAQAPALAPLANLNQKTTDISLYSVVPKVRSLSTKVKEFKLPIYVQQGPFLNGQVPNCFCGVPFIQKGKQLVCGSVDSIKCKFQMSFPAFQQLYETAAINDDVAQRHGIPFIGCKQCSIFRIFKYEKAGLDHIVVMCCGCKNNTNKITLTRSALSIEDEKDVNIKRICDHPSNEKTKLIDYSKLPLDQNINLGMINFLKLVFKFKHFLF